MWTLLTLKLTAEWIGLYTYSLVHTEVKNNKVLFFNSKDWVTIVLISINAVVSLLRHRIILIFYFEIFDRYCKYIVYPELLLDVDRSFWKYTYILYRQYIQYMCLYMYICYVCIHMYGIDRSPYTWRHVYEGYFSEAREWYLKIGWS